jgi:hypothetical protein
MLGKVFKYGLFIRLYLLSKDRFSNWLLYLFSIFINYYAHGQMEKGAKIMENPSYELLFLKSENLLYALIVGMFIFKETNIFRTEENQTKVKENTAKPKINNVQNRSEETVVSSLKNDGFDHIRKKGKLRTHAEKLLKE